MPNPQNLIPPKKGEVRNPTKGRGKGTLNKKTEFLQIINAFYSAKHPLTGETLNVTGMDRLKLELIRIAAKSKSDQCRINAIEKLMERIEGKVTQQLDLSVSQRTVDIASMFPSEDELKQITDGTTDK